MLAIAAKASFGDNVRCLGDVTIDLARGVGADK